MSDPESPAPAGLFGAPGPAPFGSGLRAALATLRRPDLHAIALQSYRRERTTEVTFSVALALVEGGFVGVIADKVYHVHPALLALISAASMFGNLSSFLWARFADGRRKVPLISALQTGCAACAASIAFLPEGPAGAWLLAAAIVVCRLLFGGVITLRSLVWTLNYPRAARGRVTARLNILNTLTLTATSLAGSFFLDARPEDFRWLYATGAVVSLVGVAAFSRVRLLGEDAHLALERSDEAPAPGSGAPLPAARPRGLVSVLRRDRVFARYQLWQFVLGGSNMMIEAPLIYLVSRELGAGYAASIALTQAIPFGLSILMLPLWASWLDRVHILDFRAGHSWLFAISQLLTWSGALLGSLWVIGAGRVLLGLARGGGSLAWNLGHNDFAAPDSAALYMGIHVTLTGVRGAIAPFLGMLLYVGWSPVVVPFTAFEIPGFGGIGAYVMLACGLLSLAATRGFDALNRDRRERAAA
jgi:MFS family permease